MNFFLDFFYPEKRRREKEQRERYQKAASSQANAEAAAAAAYAAAAFANHPLYLSSNNLYVNGGLDYNSDGYMTYGRSYPPILHPCDTGVGYNSDGYVYGSHRRHPVQTPYDGGGVGRTVFATGWRDNAGRRMGGGGSVSHAGLGRVTSGRDNRAFTNGSQPARTESFKSGLSSGGRPSQGSVFPGMFGRTRSRTLVFPFRRERGSFWGTFRLKYDPRLLKAREERLRWEMSKLYCWNSEYFLLCFSRPNWPVACGVGKSNGSQCVMASDTHLASVLQVGIQPNYWF